MITPLSNSTNVQKDDKPMTNINHRSKNKDGTRIPRFRPSVVSFGPVYDNMQQSNHFQREYHDMILRSLPPLVPMDSPYKKPTTSRVVAIPPNTKRSPVAPPIRETATLTRKLEPFTSAAKPKNLNTSIFSGPHHMPEKYSVKSLKTFRQKYFVPSYSEDEQQTRYYVAPDVNQYFQAALQDGSYFESYSEYNASDPINFRHAYSLDQSVNNLESQPKKVVILRNKQAHPSVSQPSSSHIRLPIPYQPVIPATTSTTTTAAATATRKWHKPVVISDDEFDDEETETDDSDHSFVPVPQKKRDKGKGRAMEIDTPTPSPLRSTSQMQRPSTAQSTHAPASRNMDYVNNTFMRDLTSPTPPPPSFTLMKRKRKTKSLVPSKSEAIEDVRQLGKFIKPWKEKDAEVCCICYEDVTTHINPLYYCDNALCEVIVHKNCYRIQKFIGNEENWYCDRCRPVGGGPSIHRVVNCALCPSLTGAFCKLSTPFNGLEWVHKICARMLAGPEGFVYQKPTNDYKLTIRDHIPLQRFTSVCIYCTDPLYAEYGAKMKCSFCPQSFHVTCAEKNGYWCFHKEVAVTCSHHAVHTTVKTSPQKLAVAYERWVSKRDAFFIESYQMTTDMFRLNAWRKTIESSNTTIEDSLDQKYQDFFDYITERGEDKTKDEYTRYVTALLNEFCKSYTSTRLLSVERLFLKKNFYHSDTLAYIPSSRYSFSMCDSDDEEEPKKKHKTTNTSRSSQTSDSFSPTPTPPPRSKTVIRISAPKASSSSATAAASTSTAAEKPSRASTVESNSTNNVTEKPKKKKDENVVIYSPDLICSVCNQHEFPQEAWDRYNFDDNYLQHLEDTKHLRKEGHTGAGNSWDPRVFIACSECHTKVHCGCPSRPIKKYPQKFQSFVCIQCDTKGEEIPPFHQDDLRRRGTTNINYKV